MLQLKKIIAKNMIVHMVYFVNLVYILMLTYRLPCNKERLTKKELLQCIKGNGTLMLTCMLVHNNIDGYNKHKLEG